jgi:predicted transcriptional regulator with HTH domain
MLYAEHFRHSGFKHNFLLIGYQIILMYFYPSVCGRSIREEAGDVKTILSGLNLKKNGISQQAQHIVEGKRAMTSLKAFLENRRLSAICCGELQFSAKRDS